MDLRRLYCAVIPIRASPNTPHKLLPFTGKSAQGPWTGLVPKAELGCWILLDIKMGIKE